MITDKNNRWHYLAVKSLPALFRGITASNNGDFYCLNCFHSYRTLNKLKKHERVCNNHDYCHIDMPEEGKSILKYNPGDKSSKALFIIYADLEYLLKKKQPHQNNSENSYTQRKARHKPSCYSLNLICSLDDTKNRRKFNRRKYCIKKFCNDLKELVTEIINYKEKEMILLEDEETAIYESKKYITYAQKSFVMMKIMKKNLNCTQKSEIIATTQEKLEELLIVFKI